MTRFKIRKVSGTFFPWRVTLPDGSWVDSMSWAHAMADVDHLLGLHRAHKRAQ